jgi:hypothetical protein
MSKGGGSGAVESNFKLGMGVGCPWGWEAADGAEGDSPKVADCLEEVALAALMVAACWESMVGAHIFWVPLQNRLGWLLVFRLHCWAMKTLVCPFLLVQNRTQGAWSEPPEARSRYRRTDWVSRGFYYD